MRRILSIIAVSAAAMVFASADAFGQFGIEAGYLNSRYSSKSGNETTKSDPLNGFNVGFTYNFNIVAGFSVQPGLTYSYLTDSEETSQMGFTFKGRNSEHYLNIPVRLQYEFDILPFLDLKVFTGPTFSLGVAGYMDFDINGSVLGTDLSGNFKYDYFSGKVSSDGLPQEIVDNINSMVSGAKYNRFDVLYGLGVGVGLFDCAELRFGYDWGLVGRISGDSDPYMRRDSFFITLGFRF